MNKKDQEIKKRMLETVENLGIQLTEDDFNIVIKKEDGSFMFRGEDRLRKAVNFLDKLENLLLLGFSKNEIREQFSKFMSEDELTIFNKFEKETKP